MYKKDVIDKHIQLSHMHTRNFIATHIQNISEQAILTLLNADATSR
jgi:hypothetical protein